MRYVRHLNDNWYDEVIADFSRCYEELFYKLEGYNHAINSRVSAPRPTPVEDKEGVVHPFPLAKNIHDIYKWMIGDNQTMPIHIEQTLEDILRLAYFNPFIDYSELSHEIEWERWRYMFTGEFYLLSKVAMKLHEGESINASELAMMIHVSQVAVVKQIKSGKFPATKVDSVWKIEAVAALEWIKKYNQENPFPSDELGDVIVEGVS